MNERKRSAAPKERLFPPAFLIGLTLVCAAVAALMLSLASWTSRLERADVTSQCTVVSRGVRVSEGTDRRGTRYVPEVTLAHEVEGVRYERKDSGEVAGSREDAERTISSVREGATIPCRYVAGRPDMVVYFDHRGSAWLYYGLAGLFLFFPASAFVLDLRTRRKARRLGLTGVHGEFR